MPSVCAGGLPYFNYWMRFVFSNSEVLFLGGTLCPVGVLLELGGGFGGVEGKEPLLLHVLCDVVEKLSDGSRPGEVPEYVLMRAFDSAGARIVTYEGCPID
jgi:hypothetical protein